MFELNNKEVVDFILNELGIEHSYGADPQGQLLVDMYGGSAIDLYNLSKYVDKSYMRYIYKGLLITWVLKASSVSSFTLGKNSKEEFLPIVIKRPFLNKEFTSNYKWHGLPVSPCNLIKTVPNDLYTEVAKEIYERMTESLDIVRNRLILLRHVDALIIYEDSYRELGLCIKDGGN